MIQFLLNTQPIGLKHIGRGGGEKGEDCFGKKEEQTLDNVVITYKTQQNDRQRNRMNSNQPAMDVCTKHNS